MGGIDGEECSYNRSKPTADHFVFVYIASPELTSTSTPTVDTDLLAWPSVAVSAEGEG